MQNNWIITLLCALSTQQMGCNVEKDVGSPVAPDETGHMAL